MAKVVGELLVELSANVARLRSGMDEAVRLVNRASSQMDAAVGLVNKGLATLGVGISVGQIANALDAITQQAIGAERSISQLNAVIRSTGQASGITAEEAERMAQALAESTTYDDDSLRTAIATLMRFRAVQGDTFRQAVQLLPDLAAALGGLDEAAKALGKALSEPGEGMKALKGAGVNLSDAQVELATKMRETNRVVDAQKIVLKELEKSVGGAAAAENTGLYGATRSTAKAWDDFLESLGRTSAFKNSVESALGSLTNVLKLMQRLTTDAENSPLFSGRTIQVPGMTGQGGRAGGLTDAEIAQLRSAFPEGGPRINANPAALDSSGLKKTRDLLADILRAYQEQEFALRKVSEHERMLWETQSGRYAALSQRSKQIILDRAAEIDALREEIRVTDEAQKALEALRKEGESIAEKLRTPAEALAAEKEKLLQLLTTDVGGGETAITAETFDRATKAAQKTYDDQIAAQKDTLYSGLLSEEEQLAQSYERRKKQILEATVITEEERQDLLRRLDTQQTTQFRGVAAAAQQDIDALYAGLLTEEEQLAQSYERRKKMILEATNITEGQRADLMMRLEKKLADDMAALEQRRLSDQFKSAESLFAGLAGLAKTFAGEQSAAYKVLFAASKAFAIADATIKLQQAVAAAAASGPFPWNLGAMTSVAAATSTVMSTILGTNYAGGFDKGGMIPAGKWGIVGERGPEIIQGPAAVTSRVDTAKALGGSNIRIINAFDMQVVSDYLGSDAGEQVIMNTVRRNSATVRQLAAA